MYIRKVCQFSYTVQLALWLEVFVLVLFVIFCFVFQDKWRNLSFSASGMGSRDKTKRTTGPSCSPLSTSQASVAPVANKVAEAPPGAEKKQQEVKPQPKLVSHYFHTEV